MNEYERHGDDVGAYLLGALEPAEQAAFEGHLSTCAECRDEVERLRVAADALPRSVDPFHAPASLKRSLMEAVREDAKPERKPLLERLGLAGLLRPQVAIGLAALVVALAVAVTVTQLGDSGGHRVITGSVDRSRVPDATATVTIPVDKNGPAQVRVTGMPAPKPGRCTRSG